MPDSAPRPLRTFVRLLGFLRPYRWSLAASVALAIGSQAAGLSIPALTGLVIDDAIANRNEGELVFLVSLVALAGIARALFLLGRRFIAGRQALGV
jgi:ATP-binding cassette subfamily B protein